MKILIGSLTYSLPNGVTTAIDSSVDGLIKDGHEIIIITPKYKKTRHRPEHRQVPSSLLARAGGFLIGKKERNFGPTADFHIKRIAKDFNPDIYWLHTVFWTPSAFEKQMLKSNRPKVLHYHTLVEEYGRIYGGELGAGLMKKRSKEIANKVDAIIVPSKVIEKKLIIYGVIKPIHVIPTCINCDQNFWNKQKLHKKFNLPTDSKILLYVGRVCKEKNIEALLKMMKKVIEKRNDVFLLIIGPGEISYSKKKAREMKIASKVIFSGPLTKEETQKIYGACDVFVFASKTETQGLVIGEAMMAEIPVVALDSQIWSDVYPKDVSMVIKDEADFSDAVLNILENDKKRRKITKKAKEFVIKNFSQKAMIQKQKKLFLKLKEGADVF